MQVLLNGQPRDLNDGLALSDLVKQLSLRGKLAIEINEQIIPRGEYGQHQLNDGDRIEIVNAVGGG